MSLLSKIPIQSTLTNRRIPNAFMLFVKDQKEHFVRKCPEESMSVIGTLLGKKWKSMGLEEKQVYFDKYEALKKRYDDSSVQSISLKEEEDSMDKDLIKEVNEITAKHKELKNRVKLRKSNSKKKTDESSGGNIIEDIQPNDDFKKYKTRLKSNANGFVNPTKSKEGKKKSSKRNPFLIFAREQRRNICTPKGGHASTVLGNMWHDLEDSEKKKYFDKARRQHYAVNNEVISGALSPKGKPKNRIKKKKEAKSGARSFIIENDTASSKITNGIQAKSEKISDQVNKAFSESANVEPHLPSTSHQPDPVPNYLEPLSPYQQSVYNSFRPCHSLADYNNSSIMPYSANVGGFYRPPWFGAGMPGYPPDPFASMPFWMYQQAMFPPYYPFSPYLSHCHCNMPYHGYLPGASHFRSSVFYGRANSTYPSCTQVAPSSSNGEHSSNVGDVLNAGAQNNDNHDDVSDDENRLVIVDDTPSEQPDIQQSDSQAQT